MRNIWQQLTRPLMILAPMEGVTDTVFRRVVLHAAKPDLMFTEFTSVDGLMSKGYDFVGQRLEYTPEERPLVAQIWGMDPNNFYKAASILVEMGFDGVDINMGCPDKNVIKKGGCSALVLNKPLAAEMIQATKEGLKGRLPVSVKIRIGFKEIETEAWAEFLLQQGIDALTVHGRTTKEMSRVPNRWEEIAKVVKLRNKLFNCSGMQFHSPFTPILRQAQDGTRTRMEIAHPVQKQNISCPLIIGNGDVMSLGGAREKAEKYGLDGIMIGRGVFHDPWVFEKNPTPKSVKQRLDLLLYHMELFEESNKRKPFQVLKRFFKVYINGFAGASDLRVRLMETKKISEAKEIIRDYSPDV